MDLPPFPKFNQTGLVDSTWTCVAPKVRPQQAVHPGIGIRSGVRSAAVMISVFDRAEPTTAVGGLLDVSIPIWT